MGGNDLGSLTPQILSHRWSLASFRGYTPSELSSLSITVLHDANFIELECCTDEGVLFMTHNTFRVLGQGG